MNCRTCQFEIEELEMNARLGDEARAHLSACSVCRAFHDERQSLKELIESLPPVNAPQDFDIKLRARINAARSGGNHRPAWRSFIASAPATALAATFALLVAGVLIYKQTRPAPYDGNQPQAIAGKSMETKIEGTDAKSAKTNEVIETQGQIGAGNEQEEGMTIASAGTKRSRTRSIVDDRHSTRREPPRPKTNVEPLPSNDLAVGPAPQIVPKGSMPFNTGMNQVVELPVRSASQPMRVFVNDRDGAKRRVTLAPVTFGSQDFAGLKPQMVSSQGIW
jgi:hypothetical protein